MTVRLSGKAARSSVLCTCLLLVWHAGRAAAHELPSGTGVYARGDQLVVRTTRGLLVRSSSDGQHFRFLCNEALGVEEFDAPSVLLQEDGSLLVGASTGLAQVSADLCTIAALPAFDGARVSALASADGRHMYAAAALGLYTSSDAGASFVQEDTHIFDTLALASAQLLYATGRLPSAAAHPRAYVARWQPDQPLEQHELALDPNEVSVALLGADPRNSERVFAVAHAYLGTEYLDRFLISQDGAHTWTSPLSAASLGAFAIDETNDTWLVGGASGLWRAAMDAEPVQLHSAAIGCLALVPPQLYLCDGAGAEGGLSVSADGGQSFRSVLRFDQVAGLASCPSEAKTVKSCEAAWADWTRELPPRPPPTQTDDAGDQSARDAATPARAELAMDSSSAASCAAMSARGKSGTPSACLWLAAVSLGARRRKRLPIQHR